MWKYVFILWSFAVFAKEPVKAIVTDIEGTTTSISFVHETLFPYAKAHVKEYLHAHKDEIEVEKIIKEVAEIAKITDADLEKVTEVLLTWMNEDKKITLLKALQGMIWKEGYEKGDFQGHVYLDAFEELKKWHDQGIKLYVYSSGSVEAQKLLFSHSTYGDLTPLFSGYFDTKVGGKKESSSYQNIVKDVHLPAEEILFLSDIVEEIKAASNAGMQTVWIVRDGAASASNCLDSFALDFHKVLN